MNAHGPYRVLCEAPARLVLETYAPSFRRALAAARHYFAEVPAWTRVAIERARDRRELQHWSRAPESEITNKETLR